MLKQRDISLDYIKAMGILLVVIGHYPVIFFNIASPYFFHMPLFFFVGGVLSRPNKSISPLIKKIIKEYYFFIIVVFLITASIPDVVNVFFNIQHDSLFKLSFGSLLIQTFEKNFHNNSLFTVAWFLFAYSLVTIIGSNLLTWIDKIGKHKLPLYLIISLCSAIIGVKFFSTYYLVKDSFYFNTLSQVFTGLSFYILGYTSFFAGIRFCNFYIMVACFILIYIAGSAFKVEPMVMAWSKYPSGMFIQFALALSGIYIVFFIGKLLASFRKNRILMNIGESSKYIMAFHLSVFFIMDQCLYRTGVFGYIDSLGIDKAPILLIINVISSLIISVFLKTLASKIQEFQKARRK